MSKMILSRGAVTFLFPILQCLYGYVDIDRDDVRGVSTGNNSVRGVKAYLGEFPFSVLFYEIKPRNILYGSFLSPICSGAIISSRWVLTTATPLGGYVMNTYFMIAGVLSVARLPEEVMNMTSNRYDIEIMVIHPKWHEYEYNNLGMARTSKAFRFGKELGTVRIPMGNVVPDSNETICIMNIWGPETVNHLMGLYQAAPISKQAVYFKVASGTKFCSDFIFTSKTLCLTQVDPDKRKDVCAVNTGAIVRCNCHSVGLFTGIKGKLGCVDTPPLQYTAVNLTAYLEWIRMVSEAPIPKRHPIHTISSSSLEYLSFNMIILDLILLFSARLRLKIK